MDVSFQGIKNIGAFTIVLEDASKKLNNTDDIKKVLSRNSLVFEVTKDGSVDDLKIFTPILKKSPIVGKNVVMLDTFENLQTPYPLDTPEKMLINGIEFDQSLENFNFFNYINILLDRITKKNNYALTPSDEFVKNNIFIKNIANPVLTEEMLTENAAAFKFHSPDQIRINAKRQKEIVSRMQLKILARNN